MFAKFKVNNSTLRVNVVHMMTTERNDSGLFITFHGGITFAVSDPAQVMAADEAIGRACMRLNGQDPMIVPDED